MTEANQPVEACRAQRVAAIPASTANVIDPMSKKLPFGIVSEPRVSNTKAVLVPIEDHLSKSNVLVSTMWSGEGITVEVSDEKGKTQQIELSWQEWTALKMAVKALKE